MDQLRDGPPFYSRAAMSEYCLCRKEGPQHALGLFGLVAVHAMADTFEDLEPAQVRWQRRVNLLRTDDRRDRIVVAADDERGTGDLRQLRQRVHRLDFAKREVAHCVDAHDGAAPDRGGAFRIAGWIVEWHAQARVIGERFVVEGSPEALGDVARVRPAARLENRE